MSRKTYAMAIRDTLSSEMERDDRVFVMGEDVEVLGGIFGCTRGLAEKFGVDRCFNTPISEQEMIGAGLGAACTGMRPIVELMYMDFTFVCMDQILNQALAEGNAVCLTYFVPDEKKSGGRYETASGEIRKIEDGVFVLSGGLRIPVRNVIQIEII